MSLSSLTSPDDPLFLVTDGSTMYYIIGGKAYCNDNWPGRVSNLPEINTEGLEIQVIAIELK